MGWEPLRDYSFRPETGQGLVLDARNTQNVPRANSKRQTINSRNAKLNFKLGFARALGKKSEFPLRLR
jgi:hypothetical protein